MEIWTLAPHAEAVDETPIISYWYALSSKQEEDDSPTTDEPAIVGVAGDLPPSMSIQTKTLRRPLVNTQ